MGLIAQEVEEVFPFLVRNAYEHIEYDSSEGKEKTIWYKGLNYTPLIGLLIEGIKQLDKEVRELRKKGVK